MNISHPLHIKLSPYTNLSGTELTQEMLSPLSTFNFVYLPVGESLSQSRPFLW